VTDRPQPRTFPADLSATRLRETTQGQTLAPIVSVDDAPGSPLCQVAIVMELGKVSTVHVHDRVHVYVHVVECGPQGVLTLHGDELEGEEWTFAGQTLWIPPTVPHVAVYPRFHDAPPVLAIETRTTPDWRADVRPLPTLGNLLWLRLDELRLLEHVDL
jgi:aldehyde dehydrogenase (NAD+)